MSEVFLNGAFMAREKASVSVLDRGFLLGDGIYEVIPAYHGCLFRLEEHLRRLSDSLAAVGIRNPHSNVEWSDLLNTLVQKNGAGDLSVYLQVTRGVAERDHAFPQDVVPTVFAMATPIPAPDLSAVDKGVAAMVLEDDRWKHCDIKSISLQANVLLRQKAIENGFAEAVLVRNGLVTEGAASNLFIVRQGTVITPPKSAYLLPGITRDLVVELLNIHEIPCIERDIPLDELYSSDEVWLSSSTKEVMAVTRLNEHIVGTGLPGPVWKQLIEYYREYKLSLK
ncbi:MAG: D-amino acid aminotransferase [Gammaproteobacteria bacterium]|nr:D-amino acid aminotransferase [Gammaproteobacteria bacterium]